MATCILTNWVSVFFERSLFLLLQDFPAKLILLPAHWSRRTSNIMCLSLFPCQIRSSIGLILCHWSGASRSYGLCLYHAGKFLDRYSRDVSGFLSHPLDTWRLVCGIALNLAKPTYRSKCTWYPASFGHGTSFKYQGLPVGLPESLPGHRLSDESLPYAVLDHKHPRTNTRHVALTALCAVNAPCILTKKVINKNDLNSCKKRQNWINIYIYIYIFIIYKYICIYI